MVKLLINKIRRMCTNGVNKDILIEYLKFHLSSEQEILGIKNLSVLENDTLYFKIKFNNITSSLYKLPYKKYKKFERDFKLNHLPR